jgi:hypothetical protein
VTRLVPGAIFEGADDQALSAIDQMVGEHHERLLPGSLERLEARFRAARCSLRLGRDRRCRCLFTARAVAPR